MIVHLEEQLNDLDPEGGGGGGGGGWGGGSIWSQVPILVPLHAILAALLLSGKVMCALISIMAL